MNNSRTENAFNALRNAPVEIPLEKAETFVIASAATGAFSIAALSKYAFSFHLNTIIAMTSTVAATTIAGLLVFHMNAKTPKAHSSLLHPVKNNAHIIPTKSNDILKNSLSNTFVYADTPNVPAKPKYTSYTYSYSGNGDSTLVRIAKSDNLNDDTAIAAVMAQEAQEVQMSMDMHGMEMDQEAQAANVAQMAEDMQQAEAAQAEYASAQVAYAAAQVEYVAAEASAEAAQVNYAYAAASAEASKPCIAYVYNGEGHACYNCVPGVSSRNPDTLRIVIENALVNEGLITDRKHYTFKINGNSLKINGRKQSDEMWRKYKELIESKSPNKVDRSFSYSLTVDGESITLNVENYVN